MMNVADKLTTIAENVSKVYEAGKNAFWSEFQRNSQIIELIIEGVISDNFNVQWSTKLSKESIISIINSRHV